MKQYASSLVFDPHHATVLLVKKKRPAWLAGKWTAVGGEIELCETSAAAAFRELEEEVGFQVESLIPFACVQREASICTMFAGSLMWPGPPNQKTDEEVKIWELSQVLNENPSDFSEDLRWLVQMALVSLRRRKQALPQEFLKITLERFTL